MGFAVFQLMVSFHNGLLMMKRLSFKSKTNCLLDHELDMCVFTVEQQAAHEELAARLAESEQWISQEDILDKEEAAPVHTGIL